MCVSKIQWIEFEVDFKDHRILSEILVPNSSLDQGRLQKEKLYVSDQLTNIIHVYLLKKQGVQFAFDLAGYNFPHGLDISDNQKWMAVSNYGDSSIDLRRIF